MAETDILNPVQGFWAQINDNPNPSYGFTRKTNANAQLSRARMGSWYQRDNSNGGYSFALSYMNRPWTTMLRLKQFYEIGKSGYFTVIDYDGGGRHHVGRFTSEPNPVQVANGKYNVQNMVFEEIPQARMLTYPADFVNWTRTINVVDDFLNCQVAYQGAWRLNTVFPIGGPPNPAADPAAYELYCSAANVGDCAQVQYVGFGFRLSFRLNASFGTWNVLVDGQTVVTGLNLTNGVAQSLAGYTPVNSPIGLNQPTLTVTVIDDMHSVVTVQIAQMPLDMHRVKVVRSNAVVFETMNPTIGFTPISSDAVGVNAPVNLSFVNLNQNPMAFPAITVIV